MHYYTCEKFTSMNANSTDRKGKQRRNEKLVDGESLCFNFYLLLPMWTMQSSM